MATNTAELNFSAQRASEAAESVKPTDNTLASTSMLQEVQTSGLNFKASGTFENIASSSQRLVNDGKLPSVTFEDSSQRNIAQVSGSVEWSNTSTSVCKIANPNDCVRTTNGTKVEATAGVGGVSVNGTSERTSLTDFQRGTIENSESKTVKVRGAESINRAPDDAGSVIPTDSVSSPTSRKSPAGSASAVAQPKVTTQTEP